MSPSITDRPIVGYLTFDGNHEHVVGDVIRSPAHGYLTAVEAVYNASDDRTRVSYAYTTTNDAKAVLS